MVPSELEAALIATLVARVGEADQTSTTLKPRLSLPVSGGLLMEATSYGPDGVTPLATWVAGAYVTASGSWDEVVWGRIEPAVPTTSDGDDGDSEAPDGRSVFDAFCAGLAQGPRAAAQCFDDAGVFSHAAFVAGQPRVLATGPRAIEQALRDRRPGPPQLELIALAQSGRHVMMRGWGNSPQGRRAFISSFTMTPSGALQRYLSVGVTEVTDHT